MTSDTFEIGLDEAGYGPLLGPLSIGAVRVDGPLQSLKSAARCRRRGFPRILDSKVLYRAGEGIAELERTALAAWAVAHGRVPGSVAEYWNQYDDSAGAAHPWYGNLADALPRWNSRSEIEDAAAHLAAELGKQGARLTRARAFCHLEGTLNARMGDLANKADVHLDHVGRAMMCVLEALGPGRVNCDRLGGRQDYGPFLAMLFPFVPMTTEQEAPAESCYVLGPEERRTVVRFMVNGERRSKEVALASCLAKYGRELMMACFNRTFSGAWEGVKPTAGYYKDARRFLRELEAAAGADAGWKRRLSRLR
jgi:ribonuclease HII